MVYGIRGDIPQSRQKSNPGGIGIVYFSGLIFGGIVDATRIWYHASVFANLLCMILFKLRAKIES